MRPPMRTGSRRATAPFGNGTSERCVVCSGGERPLAIAASSQLDLGFDDFSVTVVAVRGPSHATAGDPKPDFGQVLVAYTPPSGLEVKGELRAVDGVREVVAMYRRGDELFLVDGPSPHPASAGASGYDVSSALHPLTIGQSDDEDDPATRFAGRVCAIVIHRGPETDAQIKARHGRPRGAVSEDRTVAPISPRPPPRPRRRSRRRRWSRAPPPRRCRPRAALRR